MARAGARILGAASLVRSFKAARVVASVTDTWVVGTDVEYSVYVEFGTSRMSAQPYLRPAIEHAKRNAERYMAETSSINAFIRRMAMEIEAEAKRLCPVDTGRLRSSIKAEKM